MIQMITGTVKFFNASRGYGFISPSDGSKDVFVHVSAVERAGWRGLAEGQKVSFQILNEERGRKAVDLAEAE
jgi:CspA family cold shock protein